MDYGFMTFRDEKLNSKELMPCGYISYSLRQKNLWLMDVELLWNIIFIQMLWSITKSFVCLQKKMVLKRELKLSECVCKAIRTVPNGWLQKFNNCACTMLIDI